MDNIDRKLGVVCAAIVAVCVFMLFVFWLASWPTWLLLLAWTIGLGIWTRKGFRKIEVGWKGQLLCLGGRMDAIFEEGWRWVPWPFGVKVADCRQMVVKLDHLKVITADNVRVEIDGSVIRRICDLNTYFGVDEASIKQGLDDIWDQVIRSQVASIPLVVEPPAVSVLKMHVELSEAVYEAIVAEAKKKWGIEILKVMVSGVKVDEEVAKDLALKEREVLQREGQKVEFQHFIDRVKELMVSGLTREQAIEQAQLALGKATKTIDAKTIALDSATAEIVATILGRRS